MNEADKDNLKEIVGIANTAKAIAKSPGTTAKAIIEKAYDFYSCMDVLADLDPGNQTELSREIHTLNRERMQPHLLKEIKKKRTTLADAMALYEESLRKEAPWNFEQYMIYMEFGRPAEEKFYIPRRKVLKPFVDALQALEDGELDELFLSQPPRTGKALANDTPVLTTKGWKNHGDLEVGDVLFRPDGKTTKVIAVHPKCQMTHTVTFTDGTSVDCHFRHEWLVYDRRSQRVRLLETQVMIAGINAAGPSSGRGHRYNYQILQKTPIIGKTKELPVKPYTLGAWLGDGNNRQPRINGDANDSAIADSIIADGYPLIHRYVHKTTGVITYAFGGLRDDLHKIGLCKDNYRISKYIPDEYLFASIEQRLELLAGLLDTDGTLSKKEHRYHYVTCEEKLRDCVVELISTFGWRVCVNEYQPKVSSSGIVGKHKYWAVCFNPTIPIPCRLERKQLNEFSKFRRIAIKSIEPIKEPKEGNCITVEGDGMYLAGYRMIPTHNTALSDFFMSWEAGKHPLNSCLYSSCSDTVTKSFYNGLAEIMKDNVTYRWNLVFPDEPIKKWNAEYQTCNVLKNNRYPTITCRSIDGTLNGACDCDNILMGDDLCKGIEQAMNKDVMGRLWQKVSNDFLTRAKQGAKKVWIGTRWSLIDPIGIRIEMLENDPAFKDYRFKVINIPALNDLGESNFNYKHGVGFTTEYYVQTRAGFERNDDMASWNAQYMGQPIEREGSLFSPGEMRFYSGVLPEGEPDRLFMACDPAFGGSDFCAAPVCMQYGQDVYIPDVVYTNEDKRTSLPELCRTIQRFGVRTIQIEANKMTEGYADELRDMLNKKNIRCTITTKAAPTNKSKEDRIRDRAPDIRENFLFLEAGLRAKHYQAFLDNVFSFTIIGKNKHDDAPDSLAMASDMVFKRGNVYAHTFKRFI